MGRRLGKKRRRVTLAEFPMVTDRSPADRRATDLLRNAQVVAVEIDDPYEQGAKIVAFRSLRDDPLARLHCRGMIDDAQYAAGKDYRRDLELAEIGNVRAIDPCKEAVDGGSLVEPLSERQRKASARLIRAGRAMGLFQESIVRAVFRDNLFPGQVAVARGFGSDRDQAHYARLFRESLEVLALVYRYRGA